MPATPSIIWQLLLVSLYACVPMGAGALSAAEPHLLIDRLSPTLLTLHLDTEPLRSYTVQFRQMQVDGSFSTNWTNFYFVAAQPFFNHFVIVDYPTNRARIYRVSATP
jgi:hypothetical protein